MSIDKRQDVVRVPDERLWYDERLIYFLEGKRFTGIGYEDAPGHGSSEISYCDGMQDGPSRDWYPSGRLKSETYYRKNVVHGTSREWREDGTLMSEEAYEFGVLVRSSRSDQVGRLVDIFEITPNDPHYATLQELRKQLGPDFTQDD